MESGQFGRYFDDVEGYFDKFFDNDFGDEGVTLNIEHEDLECSK